MVWKKTLFIFLSLSILLSAGFFIQRHLNNKEILGVQDINSKIVNYPKESENIEQPTENSVQPSSKNSTTESNNPIKSSVEQIESNPLIPEFKTVYEPSFTPYVYPETNTGYQSNTNQTVSTPTTKEKSPEDIQSCINSYQKELDDLKANYDLDLQSENSRYSKERQQILRDLLSRGLTNDYGGVLSLAATHHRNITNGLKANYDIQVNAIKSRQQSCST